MLKNKIPGFEEPNHTLRLRYPILKGGGGMVFYLGNVQSPPGFRRYIGVRPSAHLSVEQRFGKVLGLSANFMYGRSAGEKRSKTEFLNFESQLITADLRITINFDYILFKRAMIAPYIELGAGYLHFNTLSDLRDANQKQYYLWDDGVIRDQNQIGNLQGTPEVLNRDFTYETDITPSKRNTIVFPACAGFKFKMHNFWDINIGFTYNYMLGSFMGQNLAPGNDSFGNLHMGVIYHFGQKDQGYEELRKIREEFKNAK
jgi:hypothetical protein